MTPTQCTVLVQCLFLTIYVKYQALNAKPLPFLSGTLKPLDFYIDDLEEKLKEPLTELNRLRVKGE